MATITLSVPDKLRKEMKEFDKMNWSAVAREAVTKQVHELKRKEQLLKLLEKEEKEMAWTITAGRAMKKGRAEHFRKLGFDL